MKILSVNVGSSSLKFTLIELPERKELISGLFEKIGLSDSFYSIKINGEKIKKEVALPDHTVAVKVLINELLENKVIESLDEISAVGHRIGHGGDEFRESLLLDEDVLKRIDKYSPLAPMHNPAHILGVKTFMNLLPGVPNIGVFDTSFSGGIEPEEYIFPVPYEWYEKYNVRKIGFHGTSHKYVYRTLCKYLNNDKLKVITCHLGSGGSIMAVDGGKVLDASMSFSSMSGIVMGTRSGDIDPGIIPYIMKQTGKSIDEVMEDLNKKSGLLGISGISSDARDVEMAAEEGNERAILAQNIYAQKVANFIAMYSNLLGGADAIVLTAGIGENSVILRKLILERIASLGVKLDEAKNDFRGEFRKISTEDSKMPVYVIPTNEELMIALDTMEIVNK